MIPCAQDLLWHAHQIRPRRYEADCLRLVGSVLPHEPWPDTILDAEQRQALAELWMAEFDEQLPAEGAQA